MPLVTRTFLLLLAALLAGLPPSASAGTDGAHGRLVIQVLDEDDEAPTAVRVHLADEHGRPAPLPKAAVGIMYGHWDHADGYAYQPDSSFYVDGGFELSLPPGRYTLRLSKGPEYVAQTHRLDVRAGARTNRTFTMRRWIDMPSKGWYSVDDHIHIRRSPREDPHILDWVAAEDVHVGVLLWMGDFWETYYAQYAFGEDGVYQEGDYLLTSGQEDPRTPELGHTIGMGASGKARYPNEYYYYDKVFDRLHELGGVAGYAHQAETFHGYRGLTLDGLRGKVDVMELLQYCADGGPLITEHYYGLLDLGFAVTATAGSDFPWCGMDHRYGFEIPREKAARIGNARFYTYVEGPLTYESWKAGLAAGHTFVSSGPVLLLDVDGHLPGDRVDVRAGDTVRVTLHAYGHPVQSPLDRLELVGHGQVLHHVTAEEAGQSSEHLVLEVDLPVRQGLWLAARAEAGPMHVAHTTPVYLTVDGGGFHNPHTVAHYLELSERYLRELEAVIAEPSDRVDHQAWRYREGLQARIDETREVIDRLRNTLR